MVTFFAIALICDPACVRLFVMAKEENPTTKAVLSLLAAWAIIGIAVVAPGVPGAIVKLGRQFKRYERKRLRQIVKRLARQEVVSFKQEGEETIVKITEKGKQKILKFDIDNLQIKEPDTWDGKWRIVLFDVPETKKLAREALRRKLKELGFYQFQKSAFIYPFECKNVIDFIRVTYEIGDFVKYIETKDFLNMGRFCQFLALPIIADGIIYIFNK